MRTPAYIIDIDGTLALHLNPDGSLRRGHYEYEKVSEDLPSIPVIHAVEHIWWGSQWYGGMKKGDCTITPLFVSGRMDCNEGQVRHDTLNWLLKYLPLGMVSDERLFMRNEFLPDGKPDHRPDFIVKEEIYDAHIKDKYNVLCAFDDRSQVCRLWRRLGITCFQCAEGNF